MIKHYCDRCKKELADGKKLTVELKIRGGFGYNLSRSDLCVDCLKEFMNPDDFAKIEKLLAHKGWFRQGFKEAEIVEEGEEKR